MTSASTPCAGGRPLGCAASCLGRRANRDLSWHDPVLTAPTVHRRPNKLTSSVMEKERLPL